MQDQDTLTAAQLRQGILDALAARGVIGATWLPPEVAKANDVEYFYDSAMYAAHPFDRRVLAMARTMADEGVIRRTEPGKRLADGKRYPGRNMNHYYSIERFEADTAAVAARLAAQAAADAQRAADNAAARERGELQAAGQAQLRRMIAAYAASQLTGRITWDTTLQEFTGLTSEEFRQWAVDGSVSDRWMRAANTRHLTAVKQDS